jgi:uncharacterized membrane protein YdjX (TVP38/TMEM64 family)
LAHEVLTRRAARGRPSVRQGDPPRGYHPAMESDPRSRQRRWARAAAALLVVMALLAAAWLFLPLRAVLTAVQEWLAQFGPWGIVIFEALFIVAVVAMVPGSALSVAAGLTYGMWGAPLAIAGATIGGAVAFIIARHFAHDRVAAWLLVHPHMEAVAEAVDEEGWRVVALVRLSPLLPFNMQNYLFGLTNIPFGQYVVATVLSIAPGTAFDVYIGSLGNLSMSDHSPTEWTIVGAGVVATAVLVWLVARKAKRHLDRMRSA